MEAWHLVTAISIAKGGPYVQKLFEIEAAIEKG
jgi:hypothetical protein